jgi:hypothetical protein
MIFPIFFTRVDCLGTSLRTAGREQTPTTSLPRRLTTSRVAIPVSEPVLEPPLKQAKSPIGGNVTFCAPIP